MEQGRVRLITEKIIILKYATTAKLIIYIQCNCRGELMMRSFYLCIFIIVILFLSACQSSGQIQPIKEETIDFDMHRTHAADPTNP